MTVLEQKAPAPPDLIMQIQYGPRAYQTFKTAIDLDIFATMEHGPKAADSVATELKLDKRATASLLNALVGLGFLTRKDKQFELTEQSRTYLLPSSDLYMGLYMKHAEHLDDGWSKLAQVVRTGQPVQEVNQQKTAEEFFPALAEGIFPMSYATAQMVARDLSDVNQGPARILDVAAGSGVWSIPFAEANKTTTVDALDFPAVLEVAKKFTTKRGLVDRYTFIAGDWRSVKWKTNEYNIITLGHILHSEGLEESRKLLKQCYDSLKPEGVVVVAEFLCNETRSGPAAALLFELNMLLHTTQGCVFAVDQLKALLHDAGFKHVDYSANIAEQPVLIGTK